MADDLRWVNLRLDPTTRSTLDRALAALNRTRPEPVHLVRLASGMVRACHVGDLWFCTVATADRSAPALILVIDTRPEPRIFFPTQNEADFAECCDLLGCWADPDRARFRQFLQG